MIACTKIDFTQALQKYKIYLIFAKYLLKNVRQCGSASRPLLFNWQQNNKKTARNFVFRAIFFFIFRRFLKKIIQ